MHSASHLDSILFVLISCLISALILNKLKQPTIIGYLIGGVLIGPNVLGIVPYKNVELLSEIGVGLILFMIGLELSIHKLLRVKLIAILGGSFQLTLSILATFLFTSMLDLSMTESFIIGCVVALSSTTVVLSLLAKKGELASTHGNISTGILLYQDAIAVPIIAIIPILSQGIDVDSSFFTSIVTGTIAYIITIFISARIIVPRLLHLVVQTNNKELFSICIFGTCACIAVVASHMGLSLALGAFLAGLIINESDFSNQASTEISPLKESFGAIFFAGIGMIFNPSVFSTYTLEIILGIPLIILVKVIILFLICLLFRYQIKTSVKVALGLAQIGEFSILLLMTSFKANLISETIYQILIADSILTIILSPYLMKLAPFLSRRLEFLEKLKYFGRDKKQAQETTEKELLNHIIICGYGPTSSMVVEKLNKADIKTVIIDLNYKTIKKLKQEGYHCIYGDSSSDHVLQAVNIEDSLLVVVTIPDPNALKLIVKKIKQHHPTTYIMARAKYKSQKNELLKLGANEVIWEEWEAGVSMTKKIAERLKLNLSADTVSIETLEEGLREEPKEEG